MVGYERHSETERVLVHNDGLANLNELKIQSDVIGNSDDLSFDGDEMNLHMPQDPESEAELKNLAAVPYQIVSPANNSSIIGIYQDSMLGSFLFSKEGVKFGPRQAMNLLMMFNGINEKQLLTDIEKEGGINVKETLTEVFSGKFIQERNSIIPQGDA